MCFNNYYVKKNSFNQLGIFARKDLKPGEIMWEACDECLRFTHDELLNMDPRLVNNLDEFGYYDSSRGIILPCDFAFLVNHSCKPNIQYGKAEVGILIDAVKKHDELTIDYDSLKYENEWEFICRCNTDECRGLINSNKSQENPNISLAEQIIIEQNITLDRRNSIFSKKNISETLSIRVKRLEEILYKLEYIKYGNV